MKDCIKAHMIDGKMKGCLVCLATIHTVVKSERKHVIKECVSGVRKLWLEGIDHPYDVDSYNAALDDATAVLYAFKHEN